MTQDQEIRAKALEIAAMIIGNSPAIGLNPIDLRQSVKISEDNIKRYLDLALLIETHIRKVDQL